MQYAHIAAVNSAARSQRAVELSAYDLAGDYGLGNPVDVALTKAMQKQNMDTDQLNALIKGVRRLGRFL